MTPPGAGEAPGGLCLSPGSPQKCQPRRRIRSPPEMPISINPAKATRGRGLAVLGSSAGDSGAARSADGAGAAAACVVVWGAAGGTAADWVGIGDGLGGSGAAADSATLLGCG